MVESSHSNSFIPEPNQLAGKLFLSFIGIFLILLGGVFEWLLVRSYQNAKATRQWPEVEAVIIESGVRERQITGSPSEYSLQLLYEYSFEGHDLSSDRLTPRGIKWSKKEEKIEQRVADYTVGSVHSAWVNPEQSDFAILKHDTKAAGYTVWFPALIIVGGVGMVIGAFKKRKSPS